MQAVVKLVNHLESTIRHVAEYGRGAETTGLDRLTDVAALTHLLQVLEKSEAVLKKLLLHNF